MKKNEFKEVANSVRDYLLIIAGNNRMSWGEFLRILFVCGWDISALNYANDLDQCKEAMRSMLEKVLASGEKCYGTRAKD